MFQRYSAGSAKRGIARLYTPSVIQDDWSPPSPTASHSLGSEVKIWEPILPLESQWGETSPPLGVKCQ